MIRCAYFQNFSFALAGAILLILLGNSAVSVGQAAEGGGSKRTPSSLLFNITGNFQQPSDVAVDRHGKIYVMDGVNHVVKVFHSDGVLFGAFGEKGEGQGQLLFPLGLDVGDSGRIYIADSGNHRLQVLSDQGKYFSHINLPAQNDKAADPSDVAVDERNNRAFVVDNNNHTILVVDLKKGTVVDQYGSPGSEKREFRYPFLIDMDQGKTLYVVDVINTRVQALNTKGLFVAFLGGWGVEPGEFFRPKGVAVGNDGLIYVSDGFMGVIQTFEPNGWFHSVVSDFKTGKVKKFQTPTGLCIDKKNRLYVVEMFAEKVSVHQLEQ